MNILEISSLQEVTPPLSYGGTERFVHCLSEELSRLGNTVTVTAKEASTGGNYKLLQASESNLATIVKNYLENNSIEVIHMHTKNSELIDLLSSYSIPVVLTLHNNFRKHSGWINIINRGLKNFYFVTISRNQTERVNEALVHNNVKSVNPITNLGFGLKLDNLVPRNIPQKYFLYLGVIARYKGVLDIVKEFSTLNESLIVVGPCNSISEKSYLEEIVTYTKRFPSILYRDASSSEQERNEIISSAKALVIATGYDPLESDCYEAFGLVMLEANALGIPVLGYFQGNISDYVQEGVNGYKFKNINELPELIKKLEHVNLRNTCIEYAKKFDISIVGNNYNDFLSRIVSS